MDNLVLGQRLRAHRTAAGWSLRELSKRLNSRVTPQALSQYETGQTCPRSEVLRALARVLGTRVEQLGRDPDPVRPGAIQFRHPMTLTPAVLSRAHGRLMTLTERSLALEQRVGCPLAPPSLPFIAEIEQVRTPEDGRRARSGCTAALGTRGRVPCRIWCHCSKPGVLGFLNRSSVKMIRISMGVQRSCLTLRDRGWIFP